MKRKLKKILKDKLTRDVLMFFYRNQASIDSARGVSAWVYDSRQNVQDALERLVNLKVLERDSTSFTKAYCYTRDKEIMKAIDCLIRDD